MISDWQIVERLLIAAVSCSIVGFEREMRGKSAGLRTHALVGLGSALTMIVSQGGFNEVIQPGRIVLDPSRVAAQVVSGIGFLGAGLIVLRQGENTVRGLTTAAGIWVCAAIGLACGAGMILPAVAATLIALGLMLFFEHVIERRLFPDRHKDDKQHEDSPGEQSKQAEGKPAQSGH